MPVVADPIVTADASLFVAPANTLWITKNSSGNITTKKSGSVKIRSKKKK